MDFNQSVKSMGTKMMHFRIDEARVEKMRTRINSNLVGEMSRLIGVQPICKMGCPCTSV